MPSSSSASVFAELAPDQRATLELVLRQGRSYGELAQLLAIPEETIRARARSGVSGLAPGLPAPDRAGEIADWLLGQQPEPHAARTRALLLGDARARRWAAAVSAPLRAAPGGEAVPPLPTAPDAPAAPVNGSTLHPTPPANAASATTPPTGTTPPAHTTPPAATTPPDHATPPADATMNAPTTPPAQTDTAPHATAAPHADATPADGSPRRERGKDGVDRGASRLGGALLLAAVVLVVAAVLVFAFTRGGDDEPAARVTPTATATAAAATGNDVVLRGPAGSQAVGLMRLFQANDGSVRFAIAATGVAANADGETYSLWLRSDDGGARLLGDVKDPVTERGELTAAGPADKDVDAFPQWFAIYDSVLVTLDAAGAEEPGKVILSGDLPHAR